MVDTSRDTREPEQAALSRKTYPYDRWMESIGIPIHRGYYVEDLRTLSVSHWDERECDAAFIQLPGQEGVTEARVTEIRPAATLPPRRFALDEVVYVAQGRGLTTIWGSDGGRKSFEWQAHSMFVLPANSTHQISNTRGDQPARLLHYNYLPLAMSMNPDTDFYFSNPYQIPNAVVGGEDLYSEMKLLADPLIPAGRAFGVYWCGNFFPDMRAWDRLSALKQRGAGGRAVFIRFPGCEITAHMSVFDPRRYKKAHRHGPGRVIVIPAGEGFSVLWEEGKEKRVVPWHECSVFVPPNRWFHQHFNIGGETARYLALHPLPQFSGHSERVQDVSRDQIEYPDEEPWIREKFEEELAKRGLTSLMPEEAYRDRNYEWEYGDDE
ncbi:MAG: hypothetical protein QOF51_514 [Chloroflexota bacterium]|jgi:oxalate decarboxylase/phosphoglucose isomerase-like protein (cupin superfamily)|nr:hypothetical protein [Chloroflexota bacterium]